MKYRILILLALTAAFANLSHAQGNILNCTTGPYQYTGGQQYDNGCDNTTTITKNYNEWCQTTATTTDGTGPGVTYWGPYNSSVTGTGYHTCISQNYVCWPYMNMYEVDGGNANPDGSISDSSYNRFYNQEYDTTYSNTGSNHCPETGKWYQDFKQCPTKQCAPPPPSGGNCCSCPHGCPNPAKAKRGKANGKLLNIQACCCPCSPIIIDTSGNGFVLTNAANGVKFDISGKGIPIQMAWTAPGSGNAFLCLPDSSGACDDGKDLFGSSTPQPPSSTPNGFAALAVYDQPARGGNGDGVIDARDGIFSSLRLWIDSNHDGISQPDEIYTLPQLGITSISLNYKWDQRTDQYGNVFRYRAQIGRTDGGTHMAYDVFFVVLGQTTTALKSCPALVEARKKAGGK